MSRALVTARLRLDPWRAGEHAALLTRLVADPEVMRFVGDGRVLGRAAVAERSSFATAHWMARGWGWRVAVERATGTQVALVAANQLGHGTRGLDPGEHEIGWFVVGEAQRRGYATEAAAATLGELLGPVGAPSVIARIQPGNTASLRVADALGMRRERMTTGRVGEPLLVYRRRRADA